MESTTAKRLEEIAALAEITEVFPDEATPSLTTVILADDTALWIHENGTIAYADVNHPPYFESFSDLLNAHESINEKKEVPEMESTTAAKTVELNRQLIINSDEIQLLLEALPELLPHCHTAEECDKINALINKIETV